MDLHERPFQRLQPRHIPGIYDYCDRWCERCPFADRCSVYAVTRHLDAGIAGDPLIAHLRARFEVVVAAQRQHLERDVLDDPGASGERAAHVRLAGGPEPCRHDALAREGRAYAALVDAWFETEAAALRSHADGLAIRAEADPGALLPGSKDMSHLLAAIEIVRQDAWLIPIKISRALHGAAAAIAPSDDAIQNDSNGSAKVALLAMDRSEAAWCLIDRWLPPGAAGLLAGQLATLRRATEHAFPHARRFLRPGFDGPLPVDEGA